MAQRKTAGTRARSGGKPTVQATPRPTVEHMQERAKAADVVVVGAGMAGMVAALRMAQRGLKVVIFEQDDFVGGKWGAGRRHALGVRVYR